MIGERKHPMLELLGFVPVLLLAVLFVTPYSWVGSIAFAGWRVNDAPFKLGNFVHAFDLAYKGTSFAMLGFNSLLVTLSVALLGGTVAALAAYVLARFRFAARDAIFLVIVATMMFPWQVTLIPNFVLMRDFGWFNSYYALIVPAIPKAFAVFLLRQQMISLPHETLEAARLDGASEGLIFWSIVLPMVRPALGAAMLLIALSEWNNYLWTYLVADDGFHTTLPVAINRLGRWSESYMAAIMLSMLPPSLVFLSFQNLFGQALALGGKR